MFWGTCIWKKLFNAFSDAYFYAFFDVFFAHLFDLWSSISPRAATIKYICVSNYSTQTFKLENVQQSNTWMSVFWCLLLSIMPGKKCGNVKTYKSGLGKNLNFSHVWNLVNEDFLFWNQNCIPTWRGGLLVWDTVLQSRSLIQVIVKNHKKYSFVHICNFSVPYWRDLEIIDPATEWAAYR